jgi:hypothetical protein
VLVFVCLPCGGQQRNVKVQFGTAEEVLTYAQMALAFGAHALLHRNLVPFGYPLWPPDSLPRNSFLRVEPEKFSAARLRRPCARRHARAGLFTGAKSPSYAHVRVFLPVSTGKTLQNCLLSLSSLSSPLLYSTLLYSTLLYSTLLSSTLLYSTLSYSTLLSSTLLDSYPALL